MEGIVGYSFTHQFIESPKVTMNRFMRQITLWSTSPIAEENVFRIRQVITLSIEAVGGRRVEFHSPWKECSRMESVAISSSDTLRPTG
jgi:hypothetical protein